MIFYIHDLLNTFYEMNNTDFKVEYISQAQE